MTNQAEEFKVKGNEAFTSGRFEEAIEHFTKAIQFDPNNQVLYSNRSAAFCSLKKYDEALEDAELAINLKPDWGKAYGRKGAALDGKGLVEDAVAAYKQGLAFDPSNAQMKKSLEVLENQTAGSPFTAILSKLTSHPKFLEYMRQPDFAQIFAQIKSNPSSIVQHLNDPRVQELIQFILPQQQSNSKHGRSDECCDDPHCKPHPKEETSRPSYQPEKEVPKTDSRKEDVSESEERALSNKLKEQGNALYQSKKFDEALEKYREAFSSDPTNVIVLINEAAVLFETEKYNDCIAKCEEAVEKGRELRAEYKVIAKAFSRIGSAYLKLGDLNAAIKFFNKSLTEHRTPDVLNKLKEAEKAKMLKEKELNYNPELAEQERNAGNEHFKNGRFAEAVKHYSEAIKRDEKDPRAYSNRAACYTKLSAIPEAEKDCQTCIQLDPKFIKAYIRKAAVQFIKREFEKCLETCQQALEIDTDKKHTAEIQQQMSKCYMSMSSSNPEENAKKAMNDPEIQQILSDPVMRSILEQMQTDPKAIQEHMKSPMIAAKIRKLMNAGIIRTA